MRQLFAYRNSYKMNVDSIFQIMWSCKFWWKNIWIADKIRSWFGLYSVSLLSSRIFWFSFIICDLPNNNHAKTVFLFLSDLPATVLMTDPRRAWTARTGEKRKTAPRISRDGPRVPHAKICPTPSTTPCRSWWEQQNIPSDEACSTLPYWCLLWEYKDHLYSQNLLF